MKNSLRKNLVTILTLVLSVCMLFGLTRLINTTVSFADTPVATQVQGAEVRVTDAETSGIRFRARLDKSEYDSLYQANGGNVKAGMIIVPTDYIEKAGGYTFSAFKAAGLTVSAGTVEEFASVTVDDKDYYEFSMSLINLKDGNYTRDFEGIVYIESENKINGFEEYNGKYYAYAARNEEYARNIYEVAKNSLTDESIGEDGQAIVKSYVDGVADLKFDTNTGKIVVANNDGDYTSPFEDTLYLAENGDAYVYGAKSILYNGKRVTEKYSDGANGVSIYKSKSLGTTVNDDNTITLKNVNYANRTETCFDETENSYVAMKGKYGIGTVVTIKGTGANIPYLLFGADSINGWMTEKGGKGLLITNGTNTIEGGEQALRFYGPNRMNVYATDREGLSGYTGNSANYFTNQRVGSITNAWTITYTLQLDETDGTLILALTYDGDHKGMKGSIDTGLVWGEDISAGSIVAYAHVYGTGSGDSCVPCDTTFSWTVTDISSKGATFNEDGSVTLKNVNYENMRKADFTGTQNSYVAAEGNYGIGTDVVLEFTGGNAPNVILFADNVNGNMTSDGGKGILIMPGNVQQTSNCNQAFRIYGPNRMSGTNVNTDAGLFTSNGSASGPYFSNFYFLSRFNDSEKVNTNFKWVITTSLSETNTINIIFELYEGATRVNTSTYATSLVYGTDVKAGSIIILAGVNGDATTVKEKTGTTDTFVPYDTTLKYTIDDHLSKGATFNDDGTITLKSVNYTNRTETYFDGTENSYVAKQGEFGIGTTVEIKGRGANLPYVMFGVDNINGWLTEKGGKGLLIMNGDWTSEGGELAGTLFMYGPNRTDVGNWTNNDGNPSLSYVVSGSSKNFFTINRLNTDCANIDWTITYTLALDETDGTLVIEATFKGDQNASTKFDTGLVWGTDISAGSIIAHAMVYGTGSKDSYVPIDTTFSWKVTAGA